MAARGLSCRESRSVPSLLRTAWRRRALSWWAAVWWCQTLTLAAGAAAGASRQAAPITERGRRDRNMGGKVLRLLWRGLPTSPPGPTAGLQCQGDLRSPEGHGRETVPQRAGLRLGDDALVPGHGEADGVRPLHDPVRRLPRHQRAAHRLGPRAPRRAQDVDHAR